MLRPRLVCDEKGNEGLDRLLDGFWLVPIGFDYECKLGIAIIGTTFTFHHESHFPNHQYSFVIYQFT